MNPYLEQDDVWHDFHERFIPLMAEMLNAQVGPDYIVRIDEHVYVQDAEGDTRRLVGRADVAIVPMHDWGPTGGAPGTLQAPVQIVLPSVDTTSEGFVEIRDRRSRQLIAVIEMLSPSNKRAGRDRQQYLDKRNQLLASGTHLVELDLLRGGPRLPGAERPDCDYYALVSRSESRPKADLWPIRLRDRLPSVPVPLRAPDRDVHIDLQSALDRTYDSAGYAKYIYEGMPDPPLTADDAQWARQFLPIGA
jgi:hypothetical protein